MLKKLFTIAFAAATCASATAAPVTYNFSYVGALRSYGWPESDLWLSDYHVAGSFVGEDKDLNGVLSAIEISSLKIEGTNIDNTEYIQQGNCNCHLDQFSFKLKEQSLGFAATYTDWRNSSWITNTGVYVLGQAPEQLSYYITSDTVFTLTAVPEPTTYAMMGVGLLGLAIAQRRRKKST